MFSMCFSITRQFYVLQDCIPEPVSRPDDSEYQEFRTFLAVKETGTQEKKEEQVRNWNEIKVIWTAKENV